MAAGNYTWNIPQGTYQERVFTYADPAGIPFDLTGMTARMQIRPYKGSSTVMAELTTENGGIALGGSAGTISVTILTAQTSLITSDGHYDVEIITPSGEVDRVIEGAIKLSPDVTK